MTVYVEDSSLHEYKDLPFKFYTKTNHYYDVVDKVRILSDDIKTILNFKEYTVGKKHLILHGLYTHYHRTGYILSQKMYEDGICIKVHVGYEYMGNTQVLRMNPVEI